MFAIRPCENRDYERVAWIHNAIQPEPQTPEEFQEDDELVRSKAGSVLVRVVAEDEEGQVIGYGFAEHAPWMPPDRWSIEAMVHPSARGRGAGQAIFEHVRQLALEGGAARFESWCRGDDEASLAWAGRRGFKVDRQRTESVLDLTTADLSRFDGVLDEVEAGGIRLATVTDVDDALLHQMWELDVATSRDIPIHDPEEGDQPFDVYQAFWREHKGEKIVALAFDGDRVVGISMLFPSRTPGAGAYTGFTGVYREYRGRKIALAVKLLTIREAIARGIPHMRTNNDPDNPAMLAVNAKLGYRLVPGPYRLRPD